MSLVRTIQLRLLEFEDRLSMRLRDQEEVVILLLTRRLTRRLIVGMVGLLAQSSAVMARVPASHKRDVLIFEHQSALQSVPSGRQDSVEDAAEESLPIREILVTRLDIQVHPHSFGLLFYGETAACPTLELNRAEMHRFLAVLHHLARQAEWDLSADAGWLIDAETQTFADGTVAS